MWGIVLRLGFLIALAANLANTVVSGNTYNEAFAQVASPSNFFKVSAIATLLPNGLWTCESVLNNASNTASELTNFVLGSSNMLPTFNVNTKIGFDKDTPFGTLKVGDIIVFHRPSGTELVNGTMPSQIALSRITEIQTDNKGEMVITTKADANVASIPGLDFPIRVSNYIGKVVCQY